MNKLSRSQRAQIIGMMVEGMSIRSITRLTGASKNTVAKLLVDAGTACMEYQDQAFRNLGCERIQCDEIWSFVYAKAKNIPEEKRGHFGYGDVWTWTAIDADTKLVPSFYVGPRDAVSAVEFMQDVAARLKKRVQLTTDGLKSYLFAVSAAFGKDNIDYAMLVKKYGSPVIGENPNTRETRYSPPICTGCEIDVKFGAPDPEHINTSYVERQNLSMRMGMRRFTRLTNAFSKKLDNHVHALAIYFMHYNFVRVHQTLRCTPAMQASVTDKLWSLDDIAALVEAREESAAEITRKGWTSRKSAK